MAAGVVALVPDEGPRFVPVALETLSCSLLEVSLRLRKVLQSALFQGEGQEDEEEEQPDDLRLLFRERDLDDEGCAAMFVKAMGLGQPCIVRVLFRLFGGKGGFGSLLRGQKGRGRKTTNMDAMRDLSGRRLRHSKAVERIKEWMEKQKREDELVSALTGEGPELPKPVPKSESLDPDFVRRLKRAAAQRPSLVGQGMRKLQAQLTAEAASDGEEGAKRARAEPAEEDSVAAEWLDALKMLEGLSSPEEEPEPEAVPLETVDDLKIGTILQVLKDPAAVVAAGTDAGLAADVWQEAWEASAGKLLRVVQIDAENNQVKGKVPGVRDVWFAAEALLPAPGATWSEEAAAAPSSSSSSQCAGAASSSAAVKQVDTAAASSSSTSPPGPSSAPSAPSAASTASAAASSTTAPKAAQESCAKPAEEVPSMDPLTVEDVKRFASAEEMASKVPAEVLKLSLRSLGMKCGGKPEERATRLFLLKSKTLAELPKSALAK